LEAEKLVSSNGWLLPCYDENMAGRRKLLKSGSDRARSGFSGKGLGRRSEGAEGSRLIAKTETQKDVMKKDSLNQTVDPSVWRKFLVVKKRKTKNRLSSTCPTKKTWKERSERRAETGRELPGARGGPRREGEKTETSTPGPKIRRKKDLSIGNGGREGKSGGKAIKVIRRRSARGGA